MPPLFIDLEATGAYASYNTITAIGVRKGYDAPDVIFVETPREEASVLKEFTSSLNPDPDLIVTWGRFDLRFLVTRAIACGVDLTVLTKAEHLDLKHECKRILLVQRYGLKTVARALGVPNSDTFDGSEMPALYLRHLRGHGGKEHIISHCKSDVATLGEIYRAVKPYLREPDEVP